MKRITTALFVASVALFLFSIANLSPGPNAAPPATEVFGTVDVGNLPVDETGAVRVFDVTPPGANFAVVEVPISFTEPTLLGTTIYYSEELTVGGWSFLTVDLVTQRESDGFITRNGSTRVMFRHREELSFLDFGDHNTFSKVSILAPQVRFHEEIGNTSGFVPLYWIVYLSR